MNFLNAVSGAVTNFRGAISPEIGAVGGDPDPDAYLYRSLTESKRDLSEIRRNRTNAIAYWLYLTNPWAKRAMEVITDFIIGSGVKLTATAEKEHDRLATQEVLDNIWKGYPHNFERKLEDYLLPLHLFGELALPFEVQESDGSLALGFIDSDNIEGIVMNPDALSVQGIKFKGSKDDKIWDVVNTPEDPIKRGVFLFQINKVINATRGNGVMAPVVDTMASMDDMMFSQLERLILMNNFIWDITLEGYQQPQIDKWLKSDPAPRPGSRRAHNEKVKWDAVTPDMKAQNVTSLFRLFFSMISIGIGVPEHWMGSVGYDLNRATAAEMNIPPLRRMERRQQYVHDCFKLIIDFGIVNAQRGGKQVDKGNFTDKIDTSYELDFPEVSAKNLIDLTGVLKGFTESLVVAHSQGWIQRDSAKQVWQNFVKTDYGQEIPEEKKVEGEEVEEEDELLSMYNKVMGGDSKA